MESYIVRIYRRGQTSEDIVGLVELPEFETRTAFHGLAQLGAILAAGELDAGARTEGKPDDDSGA